MSKIEIQKNKTLKLQNVVSKRFNNILNQEDDEEANFENIVTSIDNQIKMKGAIQIGPLIQVTDTNVKEDDIDVSISFMLQADKFINNVDDGFKEYSVIKETNCYYTRFIGLQEDVNYAYQKIQIEAYEDDVKLSNKTYTIFVDEKDGISTIDIFMPIEK